MPSAPPKRTFGIGRDDNGKVARFRVTLLLP